MVKTSPTAPARGVPEPVRHRRPWVAVPVLGVILLAAAMRLYHLGSQPIWLDEAASLRLAHLPLARLWSWGQPPDPGNPPLYYTLLHFWLPFGDDETRLRLPSVLSNLLTIPVVYLLGRTIAGRRLGLLAAALFATSPLQIQYSQEGRTYALLELAAAVAMLAVATIIADPDADAAAKTGDGIAAGDVGRTRLGALAWAAYVGGVGTALLAHNTAVPLIVAANLVLVGWWWARGRRDVAEPGRAWRPAGLMGRWALAQAAVLVLWGAWLPALTRQAQVISEDFWVPRPTLQIILTTATDLAAPGTLTPPLLGKTRLTMLVFGLLLIAMVALGAWSWRRAPRWVGFTAAFLLVPPAAELAVSWAWHPVLLSRTLIWTTIPLYLLVAAGLLRLSRRPVALAVALAALVFMHGWGLRNYFVVSRKEAWDEAASYVAARMAPGDAIFFSSNGGQAAFDYYFAEAGRVPEHGLPADLAPDQWNAASVTPDDLTGIQQLARRYRRVWLVYAHQHIRDPDGIAPRALEGVGELQSTDQLVGIEVREYRIR